MAAELAGQPVRFVSITAEPEEKVLPFLAKHPIAGIVALDPDRSVFAAYGVRGIPHTVLIDAQGTVRAVTRPDDVDAAAIADLLAGRTPQVAAFVDPRDRFAELLGATGGPRPLEVWLLTVPEGGEPTLVEGEGPLSFRADARKGTIRGQAMRGSSLAAALEKVLGRPVLDETGLAGRNAVELRWDAAKPEALPAAVRAQLGLALVPARRQVEVLVVRARPQAVESTAAR